MNEDFEIEIPDEEPIVIEMTQEGIDGISPTVTIGTVVTLPPGSPAYVINSGTNTDIILDFGIPQGSADWSDISNKPSRFPPADHLHDSRYYTETEMNVLLSGKSDYGHTHNNIYYTKFEIDQMLNELRALILEH
ncbi:MAG: hypothetical protein J6Y20_05590 [Lachnospiraceae bacterium]|nr:hypothetical protein [Lachnospiraceae bacterium]